MFVFDSSWYFENMKSFHLMEVIIIIYLWCVLSIDSYEKGSKTRNFPMKEYRFVSKIWSMFVGGNPIFLHILERSLILMFKLVHSCLFGTLICFIIIDTASSEANNVSTFIYILNFVNVSKLFMSVIYHIRIDLRHMNVGTNKESGHMGLSEDSPIL